MGWPFSGGFYVPITYVNSENKVKFEETQWRKDIG